MKYIIISLLLVFIATSCDKNKIPKNKMTNILYDMHIADAVRNRSVNNLYFGKMDSLALYTPILKKYGYSIDNFNYSINFYSNKPDELKIIYDEVIRRLKVNHDEYSKLVEQERKDANLWKGADSLMINSDSVYTKFDIDVPVKGKGTYMFSANYNISNDDSTSAPRMVAWFASQNKPDTIVGKKEVSIKKADLNRYNFNLYLSDTLMTQIKGHWFDYDSIKHSGKQNVKIKDIYIEYLEGEGIDPYPTIINDSVVKKTMEPKNSLNNSDMRSKRLKFRTEHINESISISTKEREKPTSK